MKKFSLIAIIILILSGTALSAKDFDWSECWCNYGGGIEKGDVIINIDGGLYYSDFAYAVNDGFGFIPPVMVEVQFAQPISIVDDKCFPVAEIQKSAHLLRDLLHVVINIFNSQHLS